MEWHRAHLDSFRFPVTVMLHLWQHLRSVTSSGIVPMVISISEGFSLISEITTREGLESEWWLIDWHGLRDIYGGCEWAVIFPVAFCQLHLNSRKDDLYSWCSDVGPGDQLPLLLPERRGAVRHPGALEPLEAFACCGQGELLHSVVLSGEQPRSGLLGKCHNELQPGPGEKPLA